MKEKLELTIISVRSVLKTLKEKVSLRNSIGEQFSTLIPGERVRNGKRQKNMKRVTRRILWSPDAASNSLGSSVQRAVCRSKSTGHNANAPHTNGR